MAKKPESLIVKEIVDWVEGQGGNVLKIYGNAIQRAGEPDLIGGFPDDYCSVHFAVEVKQPGHEARPLQIYRLAQWGRVGFIVGVVHSLYEFQRLIGWGYEDATVGSSEGNS